MAEDNTYNSNEKMVNNFIAKEQKELNDFLLFTTKLFNDIRTME